RRFNNFFGNYFAEPQPLLSPAKKIIGTDGRKMSKSYNNAVYLTDSPDEIGKKIGKMITDPKRINKSTPGRPEVCSVYTLHEVVSAEQLADIYEQCTTAQRGCVDCKKICAGMVGAALADFRERRREVEAEAHVVESVLSLGRTKVRPVAELTIEDVRKRMNII
ncbi:MAG: tryptophan--tRNA ligase, partial [Terriglobia bacterium]